MSTNFNIDLHSIKSSEPELNFTPEALDYIKRMHKKNSDSQLSHFRIAVEGGGCSGFQYIYSFDNPSQEDTTFNIEDAKIVVSPETMQYIKGSNVNFFEDFGGSGLKIENPNVNGTCGCGISFSV